MPGDGVCDEGKGELQLAGRNPFCCGTSSIPFPVECGLGLPAVVKCPTGLIGIPPVHWIFFSIQYIQKIKICPISTQPSYTV